jgi:hypothetical protein
MKAHRCWKPAHFLIFCVLLAGIFQGVTAEGSDSVTVSGYILPHTAPNANFTAAPLRGSAPLEVHFTDISTGKPTMWIWDFENDGTIDSRVQSPSHIFKKSGKYTVNLTISNGYGSDTEVKTAYISVTSQDPSSSIKALRLYVGSLGSPEWSKWLLSIPLKNAEQSLERGNKRTAAVHMQSFIRNVRLVRWFRTINQDQADYMIRESNAILLMLQPGYH